MQTFVSWSTFVSLFQKCDGHQSIFILRWTYIPIIVIPYRRKMTTTRIRCFGHGTYGWIMYDPCFLELLMVVDNSCLRWLAVTVIGRAEGVKIPGTWSVGSSAFPSTVPVCVWWWGRWSVQPLPSSAMPLNVCTIYIVTYIYMFTVSNSYSKIKINFGS